MLAKHLNKNPSPKSKLNKDHNKSNGTQNKEPKEQIRHKKPLGPFFRFCADQREMIKAEYPELSTTDLGKAMGKLWDSLSEEDRGIYKQRSQAEMQEFYRKYPEERSKKSKKNKAKKGEDKV